MAFVLAQSATYSWTVHFEEPVDGTRFRRHTFEVIFRRLPQSRIEEILVAQQRMQQAVQQNADNMLDVLAQGREHAAEVMAGWSGVKETDDAPDDLPFTAKNLKAFLEVPGIASAVLKAYGESLQIGKEKN
jgi:hypothetical protein